MNSKKYTYYEKKKINDLIEKYKYIGSKNDFINIGRLIYKSLGSQITEKTNGIWFDLNLVDDITLSKLEDYIKKRLYNKININSETDINDCDLSESDEAEPSVAIKYNMIDYI